MILETKRLYLREMNPSDFNSLCRILQDEKAMYAYEGAFSDQEVQEWLDRQIYRYQKWNFGLWAAVLKETDKMIGQCGLTMQQWKDQEVLEIGYLFERDVYKRQGLHSLIIRAAISTPVIPAFVFSLSAFNSLIISSGT